MNILAIGAHPDDVEYGCGGALLKFAQQGAKIHLYVASEGEFGKCQTNRKGEQNAAAALLNSAQLSWGGYRDTEIPCDRTHIQALEHIIRKINAQYVFVHYYDDTHQDHRNLSRCAMTAARYVANFLFYEGPTTQNFNPTIFIDIKDVLDRKMELLKAHESQVNKTNINNLTILKLAYSNVNFRGIQGRTEYAEAFVPQRIMLR